MSPRAPTKEGIALPKIQGAPLFEEGDIGWRIGIEKGEVCLSFSRAIKILHLDAKRAAFLVKGIRWLCGGLPLYFRSAQQNEHETESESDGVDLGCASISRSSGGVAIKFRTATPSVRWDARSAKYFAGRLDVERQALPH
jgi:hypothetical protein